MIILIAYHQQAGAMAGVGRGGYNANAGYGAYGAVGAGANFGYGGKWLLDGFYASLILQNI